MSTKISMIRNQTEPKIAIMQINYQPTIRVQLQCNDPLITEQHHAKACDINNILARAVKNNGLVNHVNAMKGDYSDLSNSMDYHEALNNILAAEKSFNSLPASMRTEWDNDPAKFLDFVDNATSEDLDDLGLLPSAGHPSLVEPSTVDTSTPDDEPVPSPENTSPD